ncbi:hypothetical protein AALP_AA4G034400 [Arabis alpina]|uniref:Uncharacterized protein n=1 Tax=Arabis alpina TaxID=50452 RepID=A0A087H0X3_ARAAL|nr:hypothetical protein AALP_AA4G034400 [Arabis alpina]
MASILCYSTPITIRASSGSKPDPNRKRSVSWWAPLFGLPSEPDYFNTVDSNPVKTTDLTGSGQDSGQRYRRGCLTEEKAKELRKKIAEASNFHDVMYHSAIANRLASDISDRVKDH